jgi:hypothetical protein
MEILVDYKRSTNVFEVSDLIDSENYTIQYIGVEGDLISTTDEDTDASGTLIVSFPLNINDTCLIKVFPTADPQDYENSWADYVTLVRAYVDPQQVAVKFNIPVDQAVEFERAARTIIDDMTGGFSITTKTKTIIGGGLDYLPVNERIVFLMNLKENTEQLWNYEDEDAQDVYTISNDKTSIILENQGDRKEYKTVWNTRWQNSIFGINNDYEVQGQFGWAFVPNDIQDATLYLIEDMVCGNTRHIERYINNIRTDGYSLQYVDAAFTGTGNSMVDRILSKYKKVNLNPGVL